jgi:hypothetical protein
VVRPPHARREDATGHCGSVACSRDIAFAPHREGKARSGRHTLIGGCAIGNRGYFLAGAWVVRPSHARREDATGHCGSVACSREIAFALPARARRVPAVTRSSGDARLDIAATAPLRGMGGPAVTRPSGDARLALAATRCTMLL